MLAFDPINTMCHGILIISQYFGIPFKLYKKSEAVVRLARGRREAGDRQ